MTYNPKAIESIDNYDDKNFDEEYKQTTGSESANGPLSSEKADSQYLGLIEGLKQTNLKSYQKVKDKISRINHMIDTQIELRRKIKRNRKWKREVDDAVARGNKSQLQEYNDCIKLRLPFFLVKYNQPEGFFKDTVTGPRGLM